jgi:hypothetical protein
VDRQSAAASGDEVSDEVEGAVAPWIQLTDKANYALTGVVRSPDRRAAAAIPTAGRVAGLCRDCRLPVNPADGLRRAL